MDTAKRLTLRVIVNGETAVIATSVRVPLSRVRERALKKTRNGGRPPQDFEFRESHGLLIADLSRKVGEYGLKPEEPLFLTLRVGAGGGAPSAEAPAREYVEPADQGAY